MQFQWIFVVFVIYFCKAMDLLDDKINPFLVACHTSDLKCFKIQYQILRDKVLMGNAKLNIPKYKRFMFKYGSSTCIRLSGLEQSVLSGVQMNSNSMEYTWTLQMPFLIQQVNVNQTKACANPDNEFRNIPPRRGPMKKFRGNAPTFDEVRAAIMRLKNNKAPGIDGLPSEVWKYGGGTVQSKMYELLLKIWETKQQPLQWNTATMSVSYPYALKKKNGEVHMILNDENLDVVLDIPDLSHYNHDSQFESNLYELSEWAYDVVQHIDAAQHFALPYTTQFRTLMQQTPLSQLLLLYPHQSYMDLSFNLTEKACRCPLEDNS